MKAIHSARYNQLVERCIAQYGRPRSYYAKREGLEIHHIMPCCLFPEGRDDARANLRSNLVYMTHDEHALAHHLLALMHPQNQDLAKAATLMRATANDADFDELPDLDTYIGSEAWKEEMRALMLANVAYWQYWVSDASAELNPMLHSLACDLDISSQLDADFY